MWSLPDIGYNIEEVDQGQRSSSSQSRATAAQRIRRRQTRLFIRRMQATSGRRGRMKQTNQWSKSVDQREGIWRRSAQLAVSGLSPLPEDLARDGDVGGWSAASGGRERTRQERVRFGADRKGTKSERETKNDATPSCRQQKTGEEKGRESKKAQVEEAVEAEAKEARSKKGDGGRRQRCVWTRKTRTAGMEVVQLVFWNPPSPKSAIRDSLQALSSGLPSSLWAGGDRPLAGPRAGTGW